MDLKDFLHNLRKDDQKSYNELRNMLAPEEQSAVSRAKKRMLTSVAANDDNLGGIINPNRSIKENMDTLYSHGIDPSSVRKQLTKAEIESLHTYLSQPRYRDKLADYGYEHKPAYLPASNPYKPSVNQSTAPSYSNPIPAPKMYGTYQRAESVTGKESPLAAFGMSSSSAKFNPGEKMAYDQHFQRAAGADPFEASGLAGKMNDKSKLTKLLKAIGPSAKYAATALPIAGGLGLGGAYLYDTIADKIDDSKQKSHQRSLNQLRRKLELDKAQRRRND